MKKVIIYLYVFAFTVFIFFGCDVAPAIKNSVSLPNPPPAWAETTENSEHIPTSSVPLPIQETQDLGQPKPSALVSKENTLPEAVEPPDTEWKNNNPHKYQGSYRYIAEDGKKTKYPELKADTLMQTELGEIKVPSGWMLKSTQYSMSFFDPEGRSLLSIEENGFYTDCPYYNAMPNHSEPICWEQLKGSGGYEVYSLDIERDEPAASDDDTITISKIILLLSDKRGTNSNGEEFTYGYSLQFDKVKINGNKIKYMISNKTIDEIVNSFKPTRFKTNN